MDLEKLIDEVDNGSLGDLISERFMQSLIDHHDYHLRALRPAEARAHGRSQRWASRPPCFPTCRAALRACSSPAHASIS